MTTVPAFDPASSGALGVFVARSKRERLSSSQRRTTSGASEMARKSASSGSSPAPGLNALQKLVRERMNELGLTFEEVSKRGGPPISTLHSLLSVPQFRTAPRNDTLVKLSRALDLPLDVIRAATGQAAGYTLEGVPTTLENAKGLRMIAATFEKLDPARQRTAERVIKALLDEMKNEASG